MEVIEEINGIVTVATIIPCPATQAYLNDCKSLAEKDKKHLAEFLRDLLCEINNKIIDMNRKHGMFTTNLKSAVEITGTRANSKKGKGRKIKEIYKKSEIKD